MRKEVIQIRCSADERKDWETKAKALSLTLSEFIRLVLNKAQVTRPVSKLERQVEESNPKNLDGELKKRLKAT